MNTNELILYYPNLLILQYVGKPRAYAHMQTMVTPMVLPMTTIETIAFSEIPDAGTFTLTYDGQTTSTLNWNDSATTIQTALQALTGLGSVTVTGSIASNLLTVTFFGVTPPAVILEVTNNTLTNSGDPVQGIVTETDVTLPVAVQNAFNLIGDSPAEGVQLDVIGDYVGASRTGPGFTTQITLNDADYRTLIQISTIENNAGSSTYEIVKLLNDYFPQQLFLFDHQDMEFDYYLDSDVASMDLVQVFITQGKLPKPMAVRIRLIIYWPILNMFFGMRTYPQPAYNVTPFNSYSSYQMDWPWLSYTMAIIV